MPFLLIILGVNATLAITRIFTGDTFHMDAIIIANVIGSLFAFMVYNVQRAQVLDKDYAEQRIQLEKIKDKVNEVSKTDYDKAVEWLKDKMAGGRYDGAKLLMESDAAGIKRSDIMKARNELKIKIQTTGYGKNSKAWWSLERE